MKALERLLAEYSQKEQISGFLRVTKKDEILFEKGMGYANDEKKIPFDKDTVCTFYSLSKPFCAIGLLKLKDKGIIDIDKHPSAYLPEMKGFHEKVTLRHMLHHISGLPDFEQNKEFFEKHAPGYSSMARTHLKLLSKYPSYFHPGEAAMYANINFLPLALIIENVSGMKYSDYMTKEVFQPLGMKTAGVCDEHTVLTNRAQGYDLQEGKRVPVAKSQNWMLGAGDIEGTVEDVYALNKAIKHKLLLSERTWEEVLTPSPLNNMGMGCTIVDWHGKKRIQHNGGHTGFRTLHVQLPEDDFDIILLCNSGYGVPREVISEAVYDAFYGNAKEEAEKIEMDKGYIK